MCVELTLELEGPSSVKIPDRPHCQDVPRSARRASPRASERRVLGLTCVPRPSTKRPPERSWRSQAVCAVSRGKGEGDATEVPVSISASLFAAMAGQEASFRRAVPNPANPRSSAGGGFVYASDCYLPFPSRHRVHALVLRIRGACPWSCGLRGAVACSSLRVNVPPSGRLFVLPDQSKSSPARHGAPRGSPCTGPGGGVRRGPLSV